LRAPRSGFRQGEEEVPVAAGLLHAGGRCGCHVDRLAAPVRPRLRRRARPPRRAAQAACSLRRPPAGKLLPLQWVARPAAWAKPAGCVRQGAGSTTLARINGRGGRPSLHLAATARHTSVSQTGTDSAMLRSSKRAGAGGESCRRRDRALHWANGRPGAASWGGDQPAQRSGWPPPSGRGGLGPGS